MAHLPRPWYRSPALWFLLPGVVFFLWAWGFSMKNRTDLDFEIGGYSVSMQNDGGAAGASWHKGGYLGYRFPATKTFHFEVTPRSPGASADGFPLPSYVVHRLSSPPWHYLKLPYWFLLMIYIGLWQLPWLVRYHRRRRIDRSRAIHPADAVKTADGECTD